jgi:hypothetical protein
MSFYYWAEHNRRLWEQRLDRLAAYLKKCTGEDRPRAIPPQPNSEAAP